MAKHQTWDGGLLCPAPGTAGSLPDQYPAENIRAIDPLLVDSRFYDASAFTMHRDVIMRNMESHKTLQGSYRLENFLAALEKEVGPANMVGEKLIVFKVPRWSMIQNVFARNLYSASGVAVNISVEKASDNTLIVDVGALDLAESCTAASVIGAAVPASNQWLNDSHADIVVEITAWPETGMFAGSSRAFQTAGSMSPNYDKSACGTYYPHIYVSVVGRDTCFRAEHALCNWPVLEDPCETTVAPFSEEDDVEEDQKQQQSY